MILVLTLAAVTLRTGDWSGWLFLAFITGLAASFIARPQGAGCFGFGCIGNLVVGAIGVVLGEWIFGHFYQGEVNILVAFLISLGGALVVLYAGQAIDRLLRRGNPPSPPPPPAAPPGAPPLVIDSTARETRPTDGEA